MKEHYIEKLNNTTLEIYQSFKKQFLLSRDIRLEDTTLEELDEKLKKHKLIGGRHKRTNKKNPPIV